MATMLTDAQVGQALSSWVIVFFIFSNWLTSPCSDPGQQAFAGVPCPAAWHPDVHGVIDLCPQITCKANWPCHQPGECQHRGC